MLKFILKTVIISFIFLISQVNACQELEKPKFGELELELKITAHLEKAFELLSKDVYSKEARELVNQAAQSQFPPIIELQEILKIWDSVHQEVTQAVSTKSNSGNLQQNVGQLACKFNKALKNNDHKFIEIIKYIFATEINDKFDCQQLEKLCFNLIDHSIDGFHFVLAYINEIQSSISTALMDKIILATEQYTKQHPQELFINKTEKTCRALVVYHFIKTKTCIKEMVDKNDFTDLAPCLENLGNLILISRDAKDLYFQTECYNLIEETEKKLKDAKLSRESRANIYSMLANLQIYFGNISNALDMLENNHDLPSSKFNLGALLLQKKSAELDRAVSLIEDAAFLNDTNAIVFIANKFSLFKKHGQITPEKIIKLLTKKIAIAELLPSASDLENFSDIDLLEKGAEILSKNNPESRKLKCALGLFIMENQCWQNPKIKVTASQAKQLLIEASQCSIKELGFHERIAKTNLANLLLTECNYSECQKIIDEMTNPQLSLDVQADFKKLQIELNLRQLPGFSYYEQAKKNAFLKNKDDAILNLRCAEHHKFPNVEMLKWLWQIHGITDLTSCKVSEHKKKQLSLIQLIAASKKTKALLTEQNLTSNEDLDKMIFMAEENIRQMGDEANDEQNMSLIAKAKQQLDILKNK